MASERASRSGGTEFQLTGAYTIGSTYGERGNRSGWFGPGRPMDPQAPPQVRGRLFDFPQGVNIVSTTRAYEPISYATLRRFADSYDLLRLIIETRKDAMERLRWVIQLRDSSERLTPQKKNKIKDLTKFFRKPDGEHGWNQWLRIILEDLFVIDAATLHRRRTYGGKLVSLDPIDGSTIRRVLDDWGRTPEGPGEVCYQQILKGMPAVNYTADEMLYRPRNIRAHKIYGYSPVEQIMMTINIGLRRQTWQLNFFTEGNMPPALIGVPEEWTPDQIQAFQEWFDQTLSGNLAERRKARFVPSAVGQTYIRTDEAELFGKAEEWLARVCCFAFSISPQPFLQMMNRATADTASQEAAATGLAPIQNWVKDIVDTILEEDLDAGDYEFLWRGDDELDPVKRAQINDIKLKNGSITMNEARASSGDEPYDDPIFDQPMAVTSNGLAPLMGPGSQLQGGSGDSTKQLPTPQNDEKQLSEEQVKKVMDLTAAGDDVALAAYLTQLQQSLMK